MPWSCHVVVNANVVTTLGRRGGGYERLGPAVGLPFLLRVRHDERLHGVVSQDATQEARRRIKLQRRGGGRRGRRSFADVARTGELQFADPWRDARVDSRRNQNQLRVRYTNTNDSPWSQRRDRRKHRHPTAKGAGRSKTTRTRSGDCRARESGTSTGREREIGERSHEEKAQGFGTRTNQRVGCYRTSPPARRSAGR